MRSRVRFPIRPLFCFFLSPTLMAPSRAASEEVSSRLQPLQYRESSARADFITIKYTMHSRISLSTRRILVSLHDVSPCLTLFPAFGRVHFWMGCRTNPYPGCTKSGSWSSRASVAGGNQQVRFRKLQRSSGAEDHVWGSSFSFTVALSRSSALQREMHMGCRRIRKGEWSSGMIRASGA